MGNRVAPEVGYTLLEVVVAVAILGIVLTALLTALTTGVISSDRVFENTRLLNISRSQQETVQSQAFATGTPTSTYPGIAGIPEGFNATTTVQTLETDTLQQVTVDAGGDNAAMAVSTYKTNRMTASGAYPAASGLDIVREVPVTSPLDPGVGYYFVVEVLGGLTARRVGARWQVDSGSSPDIQFTVYAGTPFGAGSQGVDATQPDSVSATKVADGRTSSPRIEVSTGDLAAGSYTLYFFNHDSQPAATLVEPVGFFALDSGNSDPEAIGSDGTHLWVVDSDSNDERVFQYKADGELVTSFLLDSANDEPEGVASDGASVWVVDDNSTEKVYRYDTSGALQGSFDLDSGNSKPEGIATDGSDLYVVDDQSGDQRVFRYSSSGALVSSFFLDGDNAKPDGIAFDGEGLWVLDEASDDRLFVYTTSGVLSKVFALDEANAKPVGVAVHDGQVLVVDENSGDERAYLYRDTPSAIAWCVCPPVEGSN